MAVVENLELPKCAFSGPRSDCLAFLSARRELHYVYVLRRPDGRPFYVGKGVGDRVFAHENEARHPNDRRSNAHKLNVIRAIWKQGQSVGYEIALTTPNPDEAYAHETRLITHYRRLHEGGPLTNLAPGGGSTAGPSPSSKARHTATLSGAPGDNPERATLNRFVIGIATMDSVVIKPASQFAAKPSVRYPSKSMGPSRRQAVALAASAAANGILLDGPCTVPRRLLVEQVDGLIENGVSCDIITSGMGKLVPARSPADEAFDLSSVQVAQVLGFIGVSKAVDLGLLTTGEEPRC